MIYTALFCNTFHYFLQLPSYILFFKLIWRLSWISALSISDFSPSSAQNCLIFLIPFLNAILAYWHSYAIWDLLLFLSNDQERHFVDENGNQLKYSNYIDQDRTGHNSSTFSHYLYPFLLVEFQDWHQIAILIAKVDFFRGQVCIRKTPSQFSSFWIYHWWPFP